MANLVHATQKRATFEASLKSMQQGLRSHQGSIIRVRSDDSCSRRGSQLVRGPHVICCWQNSSLN